MKRRIVGFLCAAVFMAVAASPAWADRGGTFPEKPGHTFPEIDGTPYAQSCLVLVTNPGVDPSSGRSQIAKDITDGLFIDSCTDHGLP